MAVPTPEPAGLENATISPQSAIGGHARQRQSDDIPGVRVLSGRDKTVFQGSMLAVVVIPLLGFVVASALLWKRSSGFLEMANLIVMYTVSLLGITVGYHRLFTHKAFETHKAIEVLLAIAGSIASQGPVLFWAATHRRHHGYSDRPGDPHSPHLHGESIKDMLRGLIHSHTGWLFLPEKTSVRRYAPDLIENTTLLKVSRLYFLWLFIGVAIPALVGGIVTRTWMGALLGFLWGGLVRVFLSNHISWSINSICHLYGGRPFRTQDQSRNNFWCAIMSFGEGWHNNHHAFPNSAQFGLKWWQIDPGAWVIRGLEIMGLAWNIKGPTTHIMEKKSMKA